MIPVRIGNIPHTSPMWARVATFMSAPIASPIPIMPPTITYEVETERRSVPAIVTKMPTESIRVPVRGISQVMMPVAILRITLAPWVSPPITAKTLTRAMARRKLKNSKPTEGPMQSAESFDPMFQTTNASATNRTVIVHMSCFVQNINAYGNSTVYKYKPPRAHTAQRSRIARLWH